MRHTIITLIAAATIAGCLETEDRPIEDKAFAVSRCDEAGACGSGEVCVEGLCREACADDSMCSEGGFCLDGLCWADAGDACAADADCAAGDLCVEGVCAPAAEPRLRCRRRLPRLLDLCGRELRLRRRFGLHPRGRDLRRARQRL